MLHRNRPLTSFQLKKLSELFTITPPPAARLHSAESRQLRHSVETGQTCSSAECFC